MTPKRTIPVTMHATVGNSASGLAEHERVYTKRSWPFFVAAVVVAVASCLVGLVVVGWWAALLASAVLAIAGWWLGARAHVRVRDRLRVHF